MKSIEVNLSRRDRNILKRITSQSKEPVRKIKRAQILLLADRQKRTNTIAEILDICAETVSITKKKHVKHGLDYAINERKRSGAPGKIDGRAEAELIALACWNPPEGRAKWTLSLLANKVSLNIS